MTSPADSLELDSAALTQLIDDLSHNAVALSRTARGLTVGFSHAVAGRDHGDAGAAVRAALVARREDLTSCVTALEETLTALRSTAGAVVATDTDTAAALAGAVGQ